MTPPAPQTECLRAGCRERFLTHGVPTTGAFFCEPCARQINAISPGMCVPVFATWPELFAFVRDYVAESACFCRDLAASEIAGKCRRCWAVELIDRAVKGDQP